MFSIFLRELRRLAVQPIYWFCMVIAPLFCYFFFTSLMHEGLPESLPLGVVDEDHTVTSRNLVRNLDAFQMTDVVKTYSNVTEARKAVQQGHIYGFYLIPQGTTSEAQSQRLPTVSFYTNYSYLVAGSLLYRDMRTMSELASGAASRTVLYAKGATERQAMAYLQPVVIDMHAVGNPWLNYNVYLSNVIIPGMLGLFIFMITVYGLGTELKFNTADELMQRSGGSVIVAVTGKLIPQLLVFCFQAPFMCFTFMLICTFPVIAVWPVCGASWPFSSWPVRVWACSCSPCFPPFAWVCRLRRCGASYRSAYPACRFPSWPCTPYFRA